VHGLPWPTTAGSPSCRDFYTRDITPEIGAVERRFGRF
jgi:hypothetical protein